MKHLVYKRRVGEFKNARLVSLVKMEMLASGRIRDYLSIGKCRVSHFIKHGSRMAKWES